MFASKVDYLLSRDLDSLPSDREVAAVNEWISSNKSFHFMRDHPLHGTTILGGGWGVNLRGQEIREKMKKIFEEALNAEIFYGSRTDRGKDQQFLNTYVVNIVAYGNWCNCHTIVSNNFYSLP